MAESFVKTFKRHYVRINPTPDAATVLEQLYTWFTDYNLVQPHSALQYVRLRSSEKTNRVHEPVRLHGVNSSLSV